MPTVSEQTILDTYPLPSYRFLVTIGTETMQFNEVTGLDFGNNMIQYVDGQGAVAMPGKPDWIKLTLRRGVVKKKDYLYKWFETINLNVVDKRDVTISLTDNTQSAPYVTWNVQKAFPTKLSAPHFKAGGNEVAIESLELLGDWMTMDWH